jgi:hypothetical protein
MDRALNSIFKYISPVKLSTINKPPIGQDFADLYAKGLMSLDEARNELGFAKQQDQKTVVDQINNLSPLVANKVIEQMTVNEIRQIAGLPPILGGDQPSKTPTAMSADNPFGWDDDRDIEVFKQFGESKDNFEEVTFDFASTLGVMILQWLNGNAGFGIADLINNIKAEPTAIQEEVAKLIDEGLLNDDLTTTEQGTNELKRSGIQTEIVSMYAYEKAPGISGSKIIPTSRDFCRRVVGFNRLYTREDIEEMGRILHNDPNYVWRRRGGWMTIKGTNTHVPYCRHYWQAKLVRRKING